MVIKLKRWNRNRAGYFNYPYLDPRRLLTQLGLMICVRCGEAKKLRAFCEDKSNKNGRTTYCKECKP